MATARGAYTDPSLRDNGYIGHAIRPHGQSPLPMIGLVLIFAPLAALREIFLRLRLSALAPDVPEVE